MQVIPPPSDHVIFPLLPIALRIQAEIRFEYGYEISLENLQRLVPAIKTSAVMRELANGVTIQKESDSGTRGG